MLARLYACLCALALAVPLLPAVASAQQEVQPEIRPQQAGNTAVHSAQRVEVSGSAPDGLIQGARLLAMTREGEVLAEQPVPEALLNREGVSGVTNDYLRNDDGELSGQLTLGCRFAQPTTSENSCAPEGVEVVVLSVTIAGQSGRSNAVRVDYTRPLIDGYEVIAPDRVRVIFSEPVRHRQGDSPTDWEVVNPARAVVSVENPSAPDCREPKAYPEAEHECTRILRLAEPLPEDAQPTVDYTNTEDVVPQRTAYEDFADNRAFTIGIARLTALDLVRPAKPNIESIDGKVPSGGEAHGNNDAPTVRLTNLTAGHTAVLTTTAADGTTSQIDTTVPNDTNSIDVTLPGLPADGVYTLSAVAVDVNGNRSDEDAKNPPREDGARPTVQYVLDTVAPQLLTATLTDARTVRVKFTEAVLPAGNAGRWFVGDAPVTAEGSGDERTLRSSTDLHNSNDLEVRWEPTSDQPGSSGRYGDRAGNGLAAIPGVTLDDLPPVDLPTITQPTAEQYTNAARVTIAGTGPDQPDLVAELFERGVDQPRSVTQVEDGRWSFDEPLDAERRYEFEVRLRDSQTGVKSQRVAVPDVVRDTTEPVVEVTSPEPAPLSADNPTERRQQYGVGDSVTVSWVATDEAPGDPERPDHGDTVDIILISEDGTRRTVAEDIEHQPGAEEQNFTYVLTAADLGGAASRELTFEVAVDDLAGNRGTDESAPILLLASLIGYERVLTEPGVVEARFPVLLVGTTLPTEWYVDDAPAQQATKLTRDGVTVIRLAVAQSSDPNDTPTVGYRKAAVNVSPLRTENGIEVSPAVEPARDAIAPTLSVDPPSNNGELIDADAVTFSGSTDETAHPNTISAFRTDASGAPQGSAIARTTAGEDGTWSLPVPLEQNAVNRIVVRAVDPSGNLSGRLPDPPYTVTEDSLDPVVRLISPVSESLVNPVLDIRWETTEANPDSVNIDYRIGGGQWREVQYDTADDGHHQWQLPEEARTAIFSIRVTATDKVGNTGSATASGLRLDFELPTLTKARATGAQVVEVTFSEPVTLDGSGFAIDGAAVRSVKGEGDRYTLILRRAMKSTTPQVAYSGTSVQDAAGNEMAEAEITATRSFAFAVKNLQGHRVAPKRARLAWSDTRNRQEELRGYRIFRDGERIAQLDVDARTFVDGEAEGRHRYTVRAVDDRGRLSSVRRTTIGD